MLREYSVEGLVVWCALVDDDDEDVDDNDDDDDDHDEGDNLRISAICCGGAQKSCGYGWLW